MAPSPSDNTMRIASEGPEPRSYDAFISYSHRDRPLAMAIHAALHRFAKPWHKLRAMRVFRDDASLSADPALWSSITKALDSSRYFILVASPQAAASEWVNREITHWRSAHPAETILLVLARGALAWDREGDGPPWEVADAVPRALGGAYRHEPRFVDMRWIDDPEQLSLREPRFLDGIAQLASAIRGIPKDALVGEDVAAHRRAMRITRAAVASLVILLAASLAAGGVAVVQRNVAREQRDLALSRQLAAASAVTRGVRLDLSLLLAVHARRVAATFESRDALIRAMQETAGIALFLRDLRGLSRAEFTPDGRYLVTEDVSRLDFREPSTGEVLLSYEDEGPGYITSHAFHPSRPLVAVGRANGMIQLWDYERAAPLGPPFSGPTEELGGYDDDDPASGRLLQVEDLAFDEDGSRLSAIHGNGRLYVWEDPEAERILVARGTLERIGVWKRVHHLRGNEVLVTGGSAALLLDINEESIEDLIPRVNEQWEKDKRTAGSLSTWGTIVGLTSPTTIPFGGGETRFPATGGILEEGIVHLWRHGVEEVLPTLRTGYDAAVTATGIPADGSRIVAGDEIGQLWVWDARTLDLTHGPIPAHGQAVRWIGFHPDRPWVVTSGADGTVVVLDLDPFYDRIPSPDEWIGARAVAFSPSGRRVVAGYMDGKVRVWDVETTRLVASASVSEGELVGAHFIADTAVVAAASTGAVTWLALSDSTLTEVRRRQFGELTRTAQSPDAARLAFAARSGDVVVTDAAGSELDRLAASTDLRALAFGFSDELFAGASASELAIHRDAEAGDRERIDSLTVPYTGGIMAVAVDPAGDRVVVASWDGSIQAFSPTTLSPLTEAMQGHDGTPRRVGFSPDGGLLASVGNNALQLWDASSLRPVGGPIRGDNTPIWDIAFSPDAALLAMAGGSGAIVLVTISEREWRKRACTLARRELSLREVAQYFPPGMGVPSICGEPGEGR